MSIYDWIVWILLLCGYGIAMYSLGRTYEVTYKMRKIDEVLKEINKQLDNERNPHSM